MFPYGEAAVRVVFGDQIDPLVNHQVHRFATALEHEPFPGMLECVPAYASVTVFYDLMKVSSVQYSPSLLTTYEQVCEKLRDIIGAMGSEQSEAVRTVDIPVCYEGELAPDLAYVADYHGMSPADVIKLHTSAEYVVYMLGFAPGFPFLGGMPELIAVPRRPSPRLLIPAGSVGIAGKQTGVYPIGTPGGWQLIGRTPLSLFRPDQHPPTLLLAGDRVRFQAISYAEYEQYRGGET